MRGIFSGHNWWRDCDLSSFVRWGQQLWMFIDCDGNMLDMLDMLVFKCLRLRMLKCKCSVRLCSEQCLMVSLLLSLTDSEAKDVKLSMASILFLLAGWKMHVTCFFWFNWRFKCVNRHRFRWRQAVMCGSGLWERSGQWDTCAVIGCSCVMIGAVFPSVCVCSGNGILWAAEGVSGCLGGVCRGSG